MGHDHIKPVAEEDFGRDAGELVGQKAAVEADDTAGACGSMQAFLNQVAAQQGKKLTKAQAQQLTDAANEIRALLDC